MNKRDRENIWPIIRGLRGLSRTIEQGTYNPRLRMANDATMSEYATILAEALLDIIKGKR